jgi:hypothetical protein
MLCKGKSELARLTAKVISEAAAVVEGRTV